MGEDGLGWETTNWDMGEKDCEVRGWIGMEADGLGWERNDWEGREWIGM